MATFSLEVVRVKTYEKAVIKLRKRFVHIEDDVELFLSTMSKIDDLGVHLGNGTYKVRIANSDKKSGKSGGYRLISYLKLVDNELYLLYIYDKSDYENISEQEIDNLVLHSMAL